MIDDSERREAAARLRQFLSEPWNERSWYHDGLQNVGSLVGTSVGENIIARLADLIDRPTCKNASGYCDVFKCSECGCKVELITEVCNEYGEPFHVSFMPSYCPSCGAEVVE